MTVDNKFRPGSSLPRRRLGLFRRVALLLGSSGVLLFAGCSNGVASPVTDGGENGAISLVLGESVVNADASPSPAGNPTAGGASGDATDPVSIPVDSSGSSGAGSDPGTPSDPNSGPADPGSGITPDQTSFTSRTGAASFIGLTIPADGENSLANSLTPDGFQVQVDARMGIYFTSAGYFWRDPGVYVAYAPLSSSTDYGSVRAASSTGKFAVGQAMGPNGFEAVRWINNVPVRLGQLPAALPYSEATAISANGLVVAGSAASGSGFVAVRWTIETGLVSLGDLAGGGLHSVATGISADGNVIVGYGDTDLGEMAFRWTAVQGMYALGALTGGDSSRANATSGDGSVVVGISRSSSGQQAFRWTSAGGMQGLGDLTGGDFYSCANAVSANGDVVVGSSVSDQGFEAIIWDPTNGLRRLADVLSGAGLNINGWVLSSATGISADGKTISGYGIDPEDYQEAWIAHLP